MELTETLKKYGHDGIIVRNEYGYIGDIIAFDTSMIREYSEEDIAESQIEHQRALANPPPLILD